MFSRHRNLILVGIAGSMLLASPLPGWAQSRLERVKFQRGHSSTVVRGTILGFDTKDYLIGAKAGQVMTLRLSSPNPYTNFVIYSINERPTDMNETTEWSEKLSESGDYLIRVLMMRAGARRKGATANYTLIVSIR
jgi:hypothetical protein